MYGCKCQVSVRCAHSKMNCTPSHGDGSGSGDGWTSQKDGLRPRVRDRLYGVLRTVRPVRSFVLVLVLCSSLRCAGGVQPVHGLDPGQACPAIVSSAFGGVSGEWAKAGP